MSENQVDECERVICVVVGKNREANIRAFKSFVRMQSTASRWIIIGDDGEIDAVFPQFLLERGDFEIYPVGTTIPQGNIFAIDATKI